MWTLPQSGRYLDLLATKPSIHISKLTLLSDPHRSKAIHHNELLMDALEAVILYLIIFLFFSIAIAYAAGINWGWRIRDT